MTAVRIAVAAPDRVRARAQALAARAVALEAARVPEGGVDAVGVAGGTAALLRWLRSAGRGGRPVVVAADADADGTLALLRAGARAVLAEAGPAWLLRHAVAVVAEGHRFVDPWVAHDVADLARPRQGNLRGVTAREQQVLVLVARGLQVGETAAELGLHPDTVKGHLLRLQHRLGVPRRDLVRTAANRGLLPSGSTRADAHRWDQRQGLDNVAVFVVAPERLARETLTVMLGAAGARVVGQAADAVALPPRQGSWTATVAMSNRSTRSLNRLRERCPSAALIVVPWTLDAQTVGSALAARAQGVVGVNAGRAELLTALRVATTGGLYLDGDALEILLADVARQAPVEGPLTHRQLAVLTLVERGYSNRAIAGELRLAEPTVKGHLRSVLRVLGARDRREAVQIARRKGILADA